MSVKEKQTQVLPIASPIGTIKLLKERIKQAEDNGATHYFCPVESTKRDEWYTRWIEFTKIVYISDLEQERDALLLKIERLNEDIKFEIIRRELNKAKIK
jgi:hypothetical protein